MSLSESQRLELEEYLETILELYSKDEYESNVENIVYHYCKRKFDIEREESVKLFYEIVSPIKKWYSDISLYHSGIIFIHSNLDDVELIWE